MPKRRSTMPGRRAQRSSERQADQRDLVAEGMKIPGVAEAVQAYGNLSRYAGATIGQVPPRVRYATGGNA